MSFVGVSFLAGILLVFVTIVLIIRHHFVKSKKSSCKLSSDSKSYKKLKGMGGTLWSTAGVCALVVGFELIM